MNKYVFHQRTSLVGAGGKGLAVSSHQTAPAGPCIPPESLQLWGKDRTLGEVNNSMVRISTSQAAGRQSTDHCFLTERQNRNQHIRASGRGEAAGCAGLRGHRRPFTLPLSRKQRPERARSCLASQTWSLRVLTRLRMTASVLRLPRVIKQEFKAPSTLLGTQLVLSDAASPVHPFSKLNRDQRNARTGSTERCAQRRDTTQT